MEKKIRQFFFKFEKNLPKIEEKHFSPYVAKKTMSICAMTTRMNIPSG